LIKYIFVWVRRPEGAIRLVGELAATAPDRNSGRFESEFEYTRAWASEAGAFALDPVSLPLDAARRFRAEVLYPPLAAFDDALPDDWGRRLLAAAITADGGTPTLAEMLLRMRGGGTGALLFTASDTAPHPDQSVRSTALSKLLAAAAQFEAGTLPPGDEFRRLLEGSSRLLRCRANIPLPLRMTWPRCIGTWSSTPLSAMSMITSRISGCWRVSMGFAWHRRSI
jgi:hypothetical protein